VAVHAESLRGATETANKLRDSNEDLKRELDGVRGALETLRESSKKSEAELAQLRAATADSSIADYDAGMPVPWGNKTWREQLGNAAWHFLHNVAARYPDKPSADFQNAAHDLFRSLQYLYPCDECRNHLNRNLRRVPGLWPPAVQSREQLSQWVCKLHNMINTQLSKSIFPCAIRQLDQRYIANCNDCVTNDTLVGGEDATPLEKPDRDAVATAARVAAARSAAERRGWRDVDEADGAAATGGDEADGGGGGGGAAAADDDGSGTSMEGLTPQQKRARLLKQKQAQSERLQPREPERKYTGGSPAGRDAGVPCTYKVESWHQSTHTIVPDKVNVLVLFSPTCHVCKQYLPHEIQQAHVKFRARGLNLAAIADVTPETESLLTQFVADEKLTYPIGIAATDMVGAPYEKFIGKYKGVPAVLEIDPISCQVRKQLWGWRIESIDSYLEERLPRLAKDIPLE
jgi:hypothetical protein